MNSAELLSEKRRKVAVEDDEMVQLVDGLILLYNMSAHKQLGKVRTCLSTVETVVKTSHEYSLDGVETPSI